MYIRKTVAADIPAVERIYAEARKFMKEAGNPEQWRDGYPGVAEIEADIADGTGYVCCDGEEIVGAFYFRVGVDPTYVRIYEGEWKSEKPYGVIHRIAVARHGGGVARFIMDECFGLSENLRIDTHRDNLPMQRCLSKNRFEYCGIIYLESGEERLAYQRVR